jgi:hypothetical protein
MARPLPITPHVAGDPITLGPDVATPADLGRALGLAGEARPGRLSPGLALVHALTGPDGVIALRWVRLPHAPPLGPAGEPVAGAVVLSAPLRDAGRALRLYARLRAGLADEALGERLRAAASREDLVRALAPLDRDGAEAPLDGADVLALLHSSAAGLAGGEAARRLALCGENRIERVRRRALLLRLLEQFVSFFALLLWVGGACAFLAGLPELGWAIFAVVLVNGVFSFFQEYRAERAVEALEQLLPREITVVRDGLERRVPVTTVVPGDLVRLDEGDQVPGDGQLLEAEGLRVDQSALTGESHAAFKLPAVPDERERVPRLERHELVFAGTSVVAGGGLAVVTDTGMASEIGEIARLTQAVAPEPSPLQREMVR